MFLRPLVSLHLDLAHEDVMLLVIPSWLRSPLGTLGIQVSQSNLRSLLGARLSFIRLGLGKQAVEIIQSIV